MPRGQFVFSKTEKKERKEGRKKKERKKSLVCMELNRMNRYAPAMNVAMSTKPENGPKRKELILLFLGSLFP